MAEYIDHWRIEKFDPTWNPTGMLEVSSFSRRYPHYIETYLQACWQSVQSALKEYGVSCKLNVAEGTMTVSTTKKTRDPYIIVKARDLLRLLSRSVPAPQGNTVAAMGSFKVLRKLRRIVGHIESTSWDPLTIINAEYNRF